MSKQIAAWIIVLALPLVSCEGGTSDLFTTPVTVQGSCAVESNLIANCGFDHGNHGWEFDAFSCNHVTSGCLSGSGCMELRRGDRESRPVLMAGRCVPVAPDENYYFVAHVQIVDGVADYCELGARSYVTEDCAGPPLANSLVYRMFQPGTTWTESPQLRVDTSVTGGLAGQEVASVRVGVSCRGSEAFAVRIDDFILSSTP